MLFLVLVVCSAAAAADVSDNSPAVQANNQTAGQLTDHNSTGNNSIQTNSSGKNSTNSSSNTVISGHVKKCSSGEPFAGVKITARKNRAVVASTTTKADGSYELEFQSKGGVFTVTASSPGHNLSSKEVTVKSGSNGTLQGSANFQLGMDNVYVSTAGSDTTGDGTQVNPYQTIRKGITEVNANGTVHLADGTYQGPDNRGLTIGKNLIITGQSQAGTVIDSQAADRIFTINYAVNVTIQNLTLENGHVSDNGGAIDNKGNLTINNTTFMGNNAVFGGAIDNEGSLAVNNSTFTGNAVVWDGGAIYNYGGNLTINNSIFTGNHAYSGGAIYNYPSSKLNVNNSTFANNVAAWDGGAIYNNGSVMTVEGSTFATNHATHGGAIVNYEGSMDIHFNRINGNTAPQGSAFMCYSGTVNATNNWWGSNAGPAGQIVGSGTIKADPWLVLKVDVSPNGFNPSSGSTITADLTYNSNGVDTSAQGHVPDGIEATFSSTPSGYVSPTSDNTVNGKAETTFTLPASGTVTVHTTVDGQTVDTILGGEYDIYVSDIRGSDITGDGSYANPYKTIKKGVSAVNDTGRVHIENGTYTGNDNKNIAIDKNIAIIGESQAGTVIDAESNGRIFTINSEFTVTIQNLTLENGYAPKGSAIYNFGTLNVENISFIGNTATPSSGYATTYGGGAIWSALNTNLTIKNSVFIGNTAIESGGGAITTESNALIIDTIFENNNANYGGGAIFVGIQSNMTVKGCIFTRNNADTLYGGGAIYNDILSTLNVENSIFTNNNANVGGAIANQGTMNAKKGTFTSNTAGWGGAIFNNNPGTLTVNDSIFTDNIASPSGGAINDEFGTVIVNNSTFINNMATYGGAICSHLGTLTVNNSTFKSNQAGSLGGAITNDGTLNINGSIFDSNYAPTGGAINKDGGTLNVTGSTFTGNSADNGGAIDNRNTSTVNGSTFTDNTSNYGGAINNSGILTVNDSTFLGNTANDQGGAIYNENTLTITDSTFTNNTAYNGGAIWTLGSLTANGSTFINNAASYSGGAIASASTLNVNNSTFKDNHAGTVGGAISSNGNLNITNSTFDSDTAYNGGAINKDGGTLNVTGSTFTGNTATNYGGAIFNSAGSNSNVEDSIFMDNTVTYAGGAIANSGISSTLNVNNSTFVNNSAGSFAGAIDNTGTVNVNNSTFTDNTAFRGGVFSNSGSLTANVNTFLNNHAYGNGGFIWNDHGTAEINFNRIVGNTAPHGSAIYNQFGTVNATLNWWGSNTSPAGKVQGNVAYDPWIILTITADPTIIDNGGISQVKADLLHDSTYDPANPDASYHDPALGHVPDGIPIELAIPWGSFTDPVITHSIILNTVNGSVEATFYANEESTPVPNPVPVTAAADGYTTTPVESAYIKIGQEANISITKIDSPNPVIAGNLLTYTITITNNGPASAEGVILDDVIDNVGVFKDGTLQYRYKVNDGTWSDWFSFSGPLHLDLGTIFNGKTAVIEMNGIIDPSTPKNTAIINTATADTTTTPGPKVATSTTTVDTQANLVVTKTSPTTVTAGNQLTYTVTVTNNGPSDAQNVVIHDTIPAVLQDVTHDSFNLDTIGAGQTKTVTITGKVPSSTAFGTVIENSATVTSDTSGTIMPSGTVSTTVDTQTALAVNKIGLADVTAGKSYTGLYTINVTNNGPSDAQNVVVTDILPLNVAGGSYTVNGGSPVSFSGNSLTVDLGTLTPGVTNTIVIDGEVASSTPAGIVSDTANVHTSTGPTYDFASNQVSTTVSVQSVLNVVKESLIGQVVAGVTYTDPIYRITVTNNGPSDARDVQIADNIPAQIVNREYRVNGGVWTSFSGPLNAFVSYIARGVSDVIEVRGSIPSSTPEGSMSNNASASVYGTTFDSNSVSTSIKRIADVDLTSTVDNERPDVGDMVTFKVKVRNNGPSDATNIQIWDKLPYGFANVHISGSKGTYANGIWTLDLASGEEATLTLKGVLTPYLAGKTTTNTAVKIHQAEEDLDAHDSTSVSIYVPKSDLYIWMAANNYNPDVGGTVILAVKLGNKGSDEAKNVSVIIPLPDGFKFLGAEGDGNWIYDPITETLIWNLESVPVGDPYLYIAGKIVSPGDLDFEAFTISKTYNANTQGLSQLSLHTNIPGLELLTLHVESHAGTDPTVKAAIKTTGMQPAGIPLTGFIVAVLMVLSGLTIPRKK